MLNTYSQLPQAWRGVFVGSIYAVFMMLLNLSSFLPLLVTPPSLDALGSVYAMITSPVHLGRHTETFPKAQIPLKRNLGEDCFFSLAEIASLLETKGGGHGMVFVLIFWKVSALQVENLKV